MPKLTAIATLLIVGFGASSCASRRQIQEQQLQREDAYQAALDLYSAALRPGMIRSDVEDYLRAKGASYLRLWGVNPNPGAFADLIKIGNERPPWYCSEVSVFVAIHFEASDPLHAGRAEETDRLTGITIYKRLQGCL